MASMPDDFLTEAVLESTRDLDRRSTREVLDAIHTEDRYAVEAIGEVLPEVERAVDVLVLDQVADISQQGRQE